MQKMRSHITRFLIAAFVWLGLCMQMAQPAGAHQANHSFAKWLSSVVKNDEAGQVIEQVEELQTFDGDLSYLIQRASEIVSRYNDDFNLPIRNKKASTGDMYHLLLVEWNMFQSANTMGKTTVHEAPKPQTIRSQELHISMPGLQAVRRHQTPLYAGAAPSPRPKPAYALHLEPHASGIAIGAP